MRALEHPADLDWLASVEERPQSTRSLCVAPLRTWSTHTTWQDPGRRTDMTEDEVAEKRGGGRRAGAARAGWGGRSRPAPGARAGRPLPQEVGVPLHLGLAQQPLKRDPQARRPSSSVSSSVTSTPPRGTTRWPTPSTAPPAPTHTQGHDRPQPQLHLSVRGPMLWAAPRACRPPLARQRALRRRRRGYRLIEVRPARAAALAMVPRATPSIQSAQREHLREEVRQGRRPTSRPHRTRHRDIYSCSRCPLHGSSRDTSAMSVSGTAAHRGQPVGAGSVEALRVP